MNLKDLSDDDILQLIEAARKGSRKTSTERAWKRAWYYKELRERYKSDTQFGHTIARYGKHEANSIVGKLIGLLSYSNGNPIMSRECFYELGWTRAYIVAHRQLYEASLTIWQEMVQVIIDEGFTKKETQEYVSDTYQDLLDLEHEEEPMTKKVPLDPEQFANYISELQQSKTNIDVAESSILRERIRQGEILAIIKGSTEHGKIEEAYAAAGVTPQEAQKAIRVSKASMSTLLPDTLSWSNALEIVRKDVPQLAIEAILDNPTMTTREARAIIKEHKQMVQDEAPQQHTAETLEETDAMVSVEEEVVTDTEAETVESATDTSGMVAELAQENAMLRQRIAELETELAELRKSPESTSTSIADGIKASTHYNGDAFFFLDDSELLELQLQQLDTSGDYRHLLFNITRKNFIEAVANLEKRKKQLARMYHPDRNPDRYAECTRIMSIVNKVYDKQKDYRVITEEGYT